MSPLRLPLLAKLVATLALVALLPLGISFYQLETNRDALLLQVQRTHIVAASSAAARVESYLGSLGALAGSLADNPAVISDPLSAPAQELLRGVLQSQADVAAVGLFSPEGEQVVLAQRIDLKDEVARALAPADPRELAIHAGPERRWLRLRRSLEGAGGYLLLVADAGPLEPMVQAPELGDEADLVLVEPSGNVLAGSRDGFAGFPAEVLDRAASGKLASGASKVRDEAGEELIVAHYQVAGTPWLVLSRQSARVAEEAQSRIRQATWVAVLGTLLIAAAVAAAAHATVIRPLRRLARAQRQLAGIGETTAPFRGSEIEQLEAAFGFLEQRLRDSEELGRVFLGRYQVVEVAGTGSMGTVFRGWDPRLHRPVALKTIRLGSEDVDHEKLSKRLHEEAITSARFNHPNIVTVYDMLHGGRATCLAMEFVEGISLERHLWAQGRILPERLIPLGAAIARALHAAHQEGLVHHDVKPANVLIGRDGAIKVTDFGISRLISSAASAQDVICGTPGYLPPESLSGQGYTPAGDLFSFGVMLYECLHGRHPFQADNIRDMMIRTLSEELEPIGDLHADVPEELSELVMALLRKDPAERPTDAGEVADILERMARERDLSWSFEAAGDKRRDESPVGTASPTLLVSYQDLRSEVARV